MRSPGPEGSARQQGGNYNGGDMKGKLQAFPTTFCILSLSMPWKLTDLLLVLNPPTMLR